MIYLTSLISISLQAKEDLSEFYKHYKEGSYQEAQISLGKIPYNKSFEGTRHYLLALTYKYLQQHELAIPNFKKAILLGKTSDDLFFEYGQSLYALNELSGALRAFQISFKKGFKKPYSLYYIAHISELLEDHKAVKVNYIKIIKDAESEKGIKQVAYLKLASLVYENTKNKFYAENYIADYIVPLIKRGIKLDPSSDTAKELQVKYDEILLKHNMHPLLLENGRLLSRQGTNLFFTQEFQSDDNVALASDNPAVANTVTDNSSIVSNSEFFYSKRYLGGRHFVLTPEIRMTYAHYFNRENSNVFQNDSYSIAPAIRGSYNFTWNRKRAELLYEFDYNYTARDSQGIEERKFFGRSTMYSLGFRRKFFNEGDTTFKFRLRNLDSFIDDLSGPTTTLYLDQLFIRENGHIILALAIADLYRPQNEFFATNSLLLRTDYLMPRTLLGMDINLSGSVLFLDTMEQSSTRGVERLLSFETRLQKRLTENTRLALGASYRRNVSKDEANFSYTRMIYSGEFRYSFD